MLSFIQKIILILLLYKVRNSSSYTIIIEDLEAYKKYRGVNISNSKLLIRLIKNDEYFRTMVYKRCDIRRGFLPILFPPSNNFMPCKNIGGGMYMPHPFSTIINAKSIGKNFIIRNNTTIGNKSDTRQTEIPIIGDNVIIGANVVIIGDISIGNNVIIGAGSVVTKDIPDDTIVCGNPAQIIKKTYDK